MVKFKNKRIIKASIKKNNLLHTKETLQGYQKKHYRLVEREITFKVLKEINFQPRDKLQKHPENKEKNSNKYIIM